MRKAKKKRDRQTEKEKQNERERQTQTHTHTRTQRVRDKHTKTGRKIDRQEQKRQRKSWHATSQWANTNSPFHGKYINP